MKYAIYCFRLGEPIDISNTSHLVATTTNNFVRIGAQRAMNTYVITALDRMGNESVGKQVVY